MLTPITYVPGTVKSKQHTKITSLALLDTGLVRFQSDGRLANIPPYSATQHDDSDISGKCRAIHGQRITGSNAGDCYFYGTHSHLYVEKNGTLTNITPLEQSGATLANNPITTVNLSSIITIASTAHGFAVGDRVGISGAATTNGVADSAINVEHIILTVPNANSYTVDTGDAASSSGSGGGASVVEKGQIAAGVSTQAAASGPGAGLPGAGLPGAGGTVTGAAQSYPRIWSFGAFGGNVVMCPGDRTAGEGQYIYIWDGNTATAPTKLTNAPTTCNWLLVVNNSIVALCGDTVKICALGASTTWSGLLYYSQQLQRVDVLHSGFTHGEKNAVLHYGNGMVLLRYTGDANIWDLSSLYEDDAVIAPYATARVGADLVFHCRKSFLHYDGGVVKKIDNTQNMDWIIQNINTAKIWHSFASVDAANQDAYFHFPLSGESEPSDYVIVSNIRGGDKGLTADFTLGEMSRTAAQRPGEFASAYYMADSGDIYRHFTNGAFSGSWYAETSFFYAGNGEKMMVIDEIRPDANQSGDITLEIIAREYPQSADVSQGTWTLSSSSTLVSVKAAGRLLKYKFSGSTAAVLGNPMANVRIQGGR